MCRLLWKEPQGQINHELGSEVFWGGGKRNKNTENTSILPLEKVEGGTRTGSERRAEGI